jgi:TonB-linked SusC/RagA family outer membrane protein
MRLFISRRRNINRLTTIACALIASAIGLSSTALAQAGSIRGRVVEAGSGRGVSDVQISVDGSDRIAITNAGGNYVFSNVPSGPQTVRVRRLGFAPTSRVVEVPPGTPAIADFTVGQTSISLDEVVVTGVPTATSRRTLGNAITVLDASGEVAKTATNNVAELLQARAPGVTVLQSSGDPGTSGTVRIRGIGSLTGATSPVVYVDGVRVASNSAGSFNNSWRTPNSSLSVRQGGHGQDASLLSNINPEDIESIEVIKGPAASTLYGADAANGVIQIITKRGSAGEQKQQWRARIQTGQTNWSLDKRPSYTTCTPTLIAAGPAAWPGCQGVAPGTVLSYTTLDKPGVLRGGNVGELSLSVTGGGQAYSYFSAVTQNREQGVIANSDYDIKSARANFGFTPSERVNYSVNVSYSQANTRFPMGGDGGNLLGAAWTFAPGRALATGQEEGFSGIGSSAEGFSVYDNRLRTDRVIVGSTINVNPSSWFHNRLTVGADLSNGLAIRYLAPFSLFSTEGQMTQGEPRNSIYTLDYAGTITSRLPLANSLTSALSFGTQYTNSQYRNTLSQGANFASASVRDINLAAVHGGWSEFVDVKSLGLFAQEQVGWQDKLFLTGALRVDNSSVFGDAVKQLYYPKLSASYIISEEPFFREHGWLDNLKLRAAWGQAGNAPDPFAAVRSYTLVVSVDANGNRVPALVPLSLGNPNVKPERGNEVELGFDADAAGGRAGAEFTFYNKTTRDALMLLPNQPSTGFPGGTYQNIGEINNRGIELMLTAIPIQRSTFRWESRLGFSHNTNKLVKFGYNQGEFLIGVTTYNQRNVEGYPLGGFWVHDPIPDGAGGFTQGPARFLGASDPTREASFANTFTFLRDFRLYGLIDYKGGFYLTNQTDWSRCVARVCKEVNDPSVSPEMQAMLVADLSINDALYTQPADFMKLRDLSLSYDLPQAFMGRFGVQRGALQLAAHNVAILWTKGYKGLDPEVNFSGTNGPTSYWNLSRVDLWSLPNTRRFTVSLDVAF